MPDLLCVHCRKPKRLHRFWWLVNGQPVCIGVEIGAAIVTTFTPSTSEVLA